MSWQTVEFEYDATWNSDGDKEKVMEVALRFQPKLITAIHCETPSGILNNIEYLGVVSERVNALLYVDFVSSGAAAPVKVSVSHTLRSTHLIAFNWPVMNRNGTST